MDLFVLDTAGDTNLLSKETKLDTQEIFFETSKSPAKKDDGDEEESDEEDENGVDYGGLPPPSHDISHIINKSKPSACQKNKGNSDEMDDFNEFMGWNNAKPLTKAERRARYNQRVMLDVNGIKSLAKIDVTKELAKKCILNGIEKKHSSECLPDKKLAEQRRKERAKTKGSDWFNMPATEITEECENDLKILQMRSVLNPKHFYKKNDLKVLPKYFQVGTVQHSPLEYYNERDVRKNKKRTMVDELLADAEFQKYNKRKFKQVIEGKKTTGYHKANLKMKKLKKKKK